MVLEPSQFHAEHYDLREQYNWVPVSYLSTNFLLSSHFETMNISVLLYRFMSWLKYAGTNVNRWYNEEFLFHRASEVQLFIYFFETKEVQLFKRIKNSWEGELKSQVRMYKLEPIEFRPHWLT